MYNTFFVLKGIWLQRIIAPIVIWGVLASLALHSLNATSTAQMRKFSYRIFFITHLTTAFAIPLLIVFHAKAARFYVVEAIGVFMFDLAVRKVTTVNAPSTIEHIQGTNLLKISATLPEAKAQRYVARPGSHVYMNIPSTARVSSSPIQKYVFDFLYNPFTVASIDEEQNQITLVARSGTGPMTTHLAHFASLGRQRVSSSTRPASVQLGIEGPYGAVGKHYQDLLESGSHRILIVAGGVGATFALPLHRVISRDSPSAQIQLIWVVRSAGDAEWALTAGPDGESIVDGSQVQLFVTGSTVEGESGGIQAEELSDASAVEMSDVTAVHGSGVVTKSGQRPDLGKMVDDAFKVGLEEKVAILVCGPAVMAREIRARIRPWVMKGREVWWHNESFGW